MYDENIQVLRRTICAGCLCQDKKLSPIKDLKKYAFFCYVLTLDEKDWVCWECRQMVVKLASFRRRVAQAQRTLADLMSGRPCQIESLSRLTKVTYTNIIITEHMDTEEVYTEVEALDPLYYPEENESVQSDDNKSVDNDDSIDNDEATGDDEAMGGDEATGDEATSDDEADDDAHRDGDEASDNDNNEDASENDVTRPSVDEVMGDDVAKNEDDDTIGAEEIVEELVVCENDDKEASIQINNEDKTNRPVAHIVVKQVQIDDESSNNNNSLGKIIAVGDSSLSNIPRVSMINLNKSVTVLPLPQPKLKIQTNTNIIKIVPGNTGEAVSRPETFVEGEIPFTVEIMSQDEMVRWRMRKRNMDFFALCSPLLRCEDCVEPFDSQKMYTAHMKGHSKEFGDLPCEICQLKFYDRVELKVHKESHYNLLNCKHCGLQWDSYNGMHSHCRAAHGIEIDSWVCDHCNREYKEVCKLLAHRRGHARRACPECGVALRGGCLKKHMLSAHAGSPLLTCPDCGRGCQGHGALQEHLKTCKDVADQTYCVECNVEYKNKYTFRAHFKNSIQHQKIRMQCSLCGEGFLGHAALMAHMEGEHDKHKKYQCSVCGKGFFTELSCKNHQRRAHSGQPRGLHACTYCGKTFVRPCRLEQHMHKHTGTKPFKCNCGARFAYQCNMLAHIRKKHASLHNQWRICPKAQ